MVAIPTLNGRNCNLFAQNLSSTGAREAGFLTFHQCRSRARSTVALDACASCLHSIRICGYKSVELFSEMIDQMEL